MLREMLPRIVAGEDLSAAEAAAAMGEIMDGSATPAQIAAFVTALHIKKETVPEIVGCARAMRKRVVRIDVPNGRAMDTCGTGGDGKGTFNISTITALVVAAAGVPVAKHGNRAASSKCGSSDLLEALGVRIVLSKKRVEACFRKVGIAYLHAPSFHPAMRHAGPVRKEIGFRTIFNLLGPLCNPAFVRIQTIGIFNPKLVRPFAEVLKSLGTRSAFTFHGAGGLDELSTTGPNHVVRLHRGRITKLTISPGTVGVKRAKIKDLAGGNAERNAQIARSVLMGEKNPYRDAVVLNTAVALVAAGRARTPREGGKFAADVLDGGKARRKLDQLIEETCR